MGEINWKDRCWMSVIYLINNEGRVLLHMNGNMKNWVPVGGHIDPGESPEEAIIREIKEEVGVDFKFLQEPEIIGNSRILKPLKFQIDKVPHHNLHMTFVFVGKCEKSDRKLNDEDEELRWFSKEELISMKESLLESVFHNAIEAINLSNSSLPKPKPGIGFGVMILKDGKILLGKRHEDPEKASSALHGEGTWTMPGGKLHFKESFEQGAVREVLEETGIKLKSVKVISLSNEIVEDAHFVTIGLFSDDIEGEAKVMEPDEITEWQWFSPDALPTPMYTPSANLLENYKCNIFYKK
jgi:8-oxo-dGTP diphosphatase